MLASSDLTQCNARAATQASLTGCMRTCKVIGCYTIQLVSVNMLGPAAGYQPEAGRGAMYPNEVSSDFAFIPFGGGARKCVGDQFALFEATVAFAMLLRRFNFRLAVPVEQVGMATGATIHTANGMMMRVTPRQQAAQQQQQQEPATAAAAV